MCESGHNSSAKDLKDAADKGNLFIARERCEFVNRCVLANIAITTTTTTTTTLCDVTILGNDSKQKPKKPHRMATVISKPSATITEKPVISISQRLTETADGKEIDDNTEPASKIIAKNIRLTPKLDRLRPRTAGARAKESVNNPHKSSTSTSSSGTKREEDEANDDNMKQISKKKRKTRHAVLKN